ncbi:MAG: acylphosphatase [Verrucomicrobia bacterium]|nr:acylphosphatase [Verrucomicrobiota bacterium]
MQKRAQVQYSGRVQGVGFRYTVRQVAHGFEVVGYVKNLPDSRVEMIVEGEETELKRFLSAIGSSDLAAYIRHETATWGDATGEFRDFSIRL